MSRGGGSSCPDTDGVLFLPVVLGYWQQHELWDGTYTLDDLMDLLDVIAAVRRGREGEA